MTKPQAILIPLPAQGHVIPMIEFAHLLAKQDIQVTLVNTEINHQRVMESLAGSGDSTQEVVNMVSIPDGMEPWEDRNDLVGLFESFFRVIPGELEALVERINGQGGKRVTCLVVDFNIGCALEVGEQLGLRRVAFWPASAAVLELAFNIPSLISDGIIDSQGNQLKNQKDRLSLKMPLVKSTNLVWSCMPDGALRKMVFDILVNMLHSIKFTDRLICNSSLDLELEAFAQYPNILPIGPLLASSRLGRSVGHFWREDTACLSWLNEQRPNSVIYIAFGSLTIFDEIQFKELAKGLELTSRPFLWVVRQDFVMGAKNNQYLEELKARLHKRGRIVKWAPQQQVLSHPCIACFISHCGWNSTVESIAKGVPFLCWPYFGDQFLNQTYICEEWKVGLGLDKDENGIVRDAEIKDKVERLLCDKSYKERIMNLQTKVMDSIKNGASRNNLDNLVHWIKNN